MHTTQLENMREHCMSVVASESTGIVTIGFKWIQGIAVTNLQKRSWRKCAFYLVEEFTIASAKNTLLNLKIKCKIISPMHNSHIYSSTILEWLLGRRIMWTACLFMYASQCCRGYFWFWSFRCVGGLVHRYLGWYCEVIKFNSVASWCGFPPMCHVPSYTIVLHLVVQMREDQWQSVQCTYPFSPVPDHVAKCTHPVMTVY